MGATYTRQSTITDGAVIEASHFNDEFDQLLASFAVSTGHSHDGTAAEGGPVTKLLGTSLTLGDGTAGTDITLTFDGETNDGVLTWMEDEDLFKFSDDINVGVDDTGYDVKFFGATSGSYWLWDESADGVVQIGSLTVGVDDAGHDVKFFGNTASAYMLWDTSADDLVLAGSAGIDLAGDIDVDGTANLDNTDIDGTLAVDGTTISLDATTSLNIDNSNTSNGITIGTATSGVPISIGHTTSETTINDNATITGNLSVGGTFDVTGTIDFSDSAITNAGDIQLDSITGDGDTNTSITFSGSDVITVTAGGDTQFTFNNGSILPTTDNDIDLGSASYEFKDGYFDGTVYADAINFNGTAIASTAAEINILDGDNSASSVTVVDADRIILNDNGTMKQVAVSALNTYTSSSIAADDVSAGDAAVSIATSSGAVTIDSNASSVTVDGHTGVTLQSTNSGDITLDSVADINLDAGGADILLKDDGTTFGGLVNTSGNLIIKSGTTTAATFSGANTTLAGTLGVGAITGTSTIQGTTITATTAFVPDASDGAALGTTALEFSDLFLADGAVINLGDDQDITMTHVADTGVTIGGSHANGTNVQITNSATDGDSVVQFALGGTVQYSMGVEDGDSDKFVINYGTGALGAQPALEISSAGAVTVPGNLTVSGTLSGAASAGFALAMAVAL
jgi:hypothetical protein